MSSVTASETLRSLRKRIAGIAANGLRPTLATLLEEEPGLTDELSPAARVRAVMPKGNPAGTC